MIVQYIDGISKENKLYYISIVIFCLWFFKDAYIPDISFIVAVVFSIAIVYYLNEKKENSIDNMNTGLHYKLVSLLKEEGKKEPDHFYLEPDMINFFYDIREFRIYNRDSYLKAIRHINSLLKIKKDLENDYTYVKEPQIKGWQNFGSLEKARLQKNIKNHKGMFQNASVLSEKAVNYLYSFAISLPSGILKEKHHTACEKFHILTKRILDDILHKCQNGTSDPMLGQDYGLPKPFRKKELNDSFEFVYI